MHVPTPEEIKKTGQVIPYQTLVAWAKASGFAVRRSKGGTSHIRYWHEEYPEICNNFVATSDKLAAQREFANLLEEVQLRKLSEAFKAATEEKEKLLALVPDHLNAKFDHETGSLVLTDKQLPQLGITIEPDQFHLLENKIRNTLDSEKRVLFTLINQAKMIYDIDISVPKRGTFDGILSHRVYGLAPIMIPAYKPGDAPNQCRNILNEYIKEVQAQDRAHTKRLNKILGMSFVQEIEVASHARRGERTFTVHYQSPKLHELCTDFHAYSHQRVRPSGKDDIHTARISEAELAGLERRIYGIANGHTQAGHEVHL